MSDWKLEVSFATPAFLGDGDQSGAWRTPPFKALLRQWWRVAAAKECEYDANRLRERELALFGSSAGETGGKSKVRLRLDLWKDGAFEKRGNDPKVLHPEVGNGGRRIGSQLYLGYDPIGFQRGVGTVVNMEHAIAPGEKNRLQIRGPESVAAAVQLAAWFGTVGSRSRNGWGSLTAKVVKGKGIESIGKILDESVKLRSCRRLEESLQLDWPHAIGCDDRDGALVWKSRQDFGRWEDAMKHLAEVKIAFRTALPVNGGFRDRHLLAYPVTHHNVRAWGPQERLANQIRFKVVRSGGRFYALVYHLPCDIPSELKRKLGRAAPSLADQLRVWRAVHDVLDTRMQRLGGLA